MEIIKNLPIYQQFEKIERIWNQCSHLILKSPTGSGKSLALPYLLWSKNLVSGKILVVQPRRIAARMLAKHCAKLAGWTLGKEVGYQVRFDKQYGDQTNIIYATDGVVLNKLLRNGEIDEFEVLIIDEFHERSAQIDLCLALALNFWKSKKPNFRVIVTSATLNEESLAKYLPSAKCIEFFGRSFPVEIEHRSLPIQVPVWKSVVEIMPSLLNKMHGDILVFMDGAYEISKTVNAILSSQWSRGIDVRPLYGDLSEEKQDLALQANEKRKIIVSTNIAETSLTIEGIKIVIDTGKAKKMRYDNARGVNALLSEAISKSSADQRAGRAGRTEPGFCLRLWSKSDHEIRPDFDIPEILHIDLSEIYLNLLGGGLKLEQINLIDAISLDSMNEARFKLKNLGALDEKENLTEHGLKMSRLPVHPVWAHALLIAKERNIVPAIALVLAMLEGRSVVRTVELSDFFPMRNPRSDIYCLLLAYEAGARTNFSLKECKKLGINVGRCYEAERLARALCEMVGISFRLDLPNYENLANALLKSFSQNIAYLVSDARRIYEDSLGRRLHLSKHSVIAKEKFVLPLQIVEKKIQGRLILEMEWVSGLDESWIRKALGAQIVKSKSTVFDLDSRKVLNKEIEAFGKIILSLSEEEEIRTEIKAPAYAKALMCGDLKLKNWNTQVDKFLNRISFLASQFPELGMLEMDEETKYLFLEQLCLSGSSWKEIKNLDVYGPLLNCYSEEQRELLDKAAPESFDLGAGKSPYILDYSDKKEVILRAYLQDLYEVKSHPTIVFGKYSVIVEILAPNRRPVQRTSNLLSFWQGTYPLVRKDLAGRYPKHEWR